MVRAQVAEHPRVVAARREFVREVCRLVYEDEGADLAEVERLRKRVVYLKARHRAGSRRGKGKRSMAWTKLTLPPAKGATPALSISTVGRISWTQGLAKAMGEIQAVEVLYDPDTHRLGIRPAQPEVGITPMSDGKSISAKRHLAAGGVLELIAGLLPLRELPAAMDDDGVWAVQLPPPSVPPTRGEPPTVPPARGDKA